MCSHIRTCAEPRLCAHKRCPRKNPRTRHKLRCKFLEVCKTLRTRNFWFAGMFAGTFADPFADKCCALLAGGVCEGDLQEELMAAVYRSCFAEQTHTMEVLVGTASVVASSWKGNRTRHLQVTPTKAPPPTHERMLYLMAEQ